MPKELVSADDFEHVWRSTVTAQEAAMKLGIAVVTANKQARSLQLPDHITGSCLKELQAHHFAAWDSYGTVREFAADVDVHVSNHNLTLLNLAAQRMGLAKKELDVPPMTPEGDQANDIIADWIDWWREGFGTDLPETTVKTVARQVKELIRAGYHTDSIKVGIFKWSTKLIEGGFVPSPQIIFQTAVRHHAVTNAHAQDSARALIAGTEKIDAVIDSTLTPRIEERPW